MNKGESNWRAGYRGKGDRGKGMADHVDLIGHIVGPLPSLRWEALGSFELGSNMIKLMF